MSVDDAITRLAQEDASRVLAIIASRYGDIDLADDAVQDALVEATRTWPERGIPLNPAGWLMTVARRRALDRIRSEASDRVRAESFGIEAANDAPIVGGRHELIDDEAELWSEPDADSSQLRLMLLCCHPALDPDSRVALTLRLVGGLSTAEIAAAFLVPEATLAQRVVRAKRKIRTAAIPMSMPERLEDRLSVLMAVLYLIFNEGYLSNSGDDLVTRPDLNAVAIRLTRQLTTLAPDSSEASGLLALELFAVARARSRVDDEGNVILLADQDRSSWDRAMISEANRILQAAMAKMTPGPYQVQALIASNHANATSEADTDWVAIGRLYLQLEEMTGSAVVRMNRAVAVAMADGAHAGLTVLQSIEGLDDHHRFHAVRAELLRRCDRKDEAVEAYELALSLGPPPAEARYLTTQLAAVNEGL